MEYCALGDLSYFIKKRDQLGAHDSTRDMVRKYPNPASGGLNEVVTRHFLKQLASSLEFLRASNLIHRDVKPQNLLLNPPPQYYANKRPEDMPYAASDDSLIPLVGIKSLPMLKIADFGFARSLPSTSLAETLCGSPLYMAPEILRYEKYDAKADLWSVGTVLYEMVTGRPPYKANNHVELLRKIEKQEGPIAFKSEYAVSRPLKDLIRRLLVRKPVERMNFPEFFKHEVVSGEIPDLVEEDIPQGRPSSADMEEIVKAERRKSSLSIGIPQDGDVDPRNQSPRTQALTTAARRSSEAVSHTRQYSGTPPRPSPMRNPSLEKVQATASTPRRPSMTSHVTAPGRQEMGQQDLTGVVLGKQKGQHVPSSNTSLLREQVQQRNKERAAAALQRQHERKSSRDEREIAAQEVADMRDYVVVEKLAVEMNAFADEMAASPHLRGDHQKSPSSVEPRTGTITRRATTQGTPLTTGTSAPQSRAMQITTKHRPDAVSHNRQASYERRYGPSPTSATSAISKALNLASGRLFGIGFSPPLGVGRSSRSPPIGYSPFPTYPAAPGSLVMASTSESPPAVGTLSEDQKIMHEIEEIATRSDVVYGFAEVKYKQIIPMSPTQVKAETRRMASDSPDAGVPDDAGLTVDAIVGLCEEAFVLYLKTLSLLAKSMDIAGAWWAQKNRQGGPTDTNELQLSSPVGPRINNVVQWIRTRFNDVLEKADYVRLKLKDTQKRLPVNHPSHPSSHPQLPDQPSVGNLGGSVADNVVVTPGVSAEKLMYDRGLEMSRAAAVNEITGADFPGCELNYVTAIKLLEAVIEIEKPDEPEEIGGFPLKESDRESIGKCKSSFFIIRLRNSSMQY